jgi:hypothetical protein
MIWVPLLQVPWSWQVPARRFDSGGSGRFQNKARRKVSADGPTGAGAGNALSALAALGCGLAAAQGDLLFIALFGAASVVAIIEAI